MPVPDDAMVNNIMGLNVCFFGLLQKVTTIMDEVHIAILRLLQLAPPMTEEGLVPCSTYNYGTVRIIHIQLYSPY
jgi:hypothetical protein